MYTTKRLRCERAVKEDLAGILAIEHDPYNSLYTFTGDMEEHCREIEDPDIFFLAIREKEGGALIGYLIVDIDRESQRLEFRRMALSRRCEGYGREVLDGALRMAFEQWGANKVWLEAYPDNAVGCHLYESMGFHKDGVLRQHHKAERGFLDQVQYSMLKDEYRDEYLVKYRR